MEKPRLRFTLLGTFRYAIGEADYQTINPDLTGAVIAYMAFTGAECTRYKIGMNCWEDEPSNQTRTRRLDFVREVLFRDNKLAWEDYITATGDAFFLKPHMYETDLRTFLEYYKAAEKVEGSERERLMSEANKCYTGSCDLLEGVGGKWIDAERAAIRAKAKRAREAAERYTVVAGAEGAATCSAVLEQEAEYSDSSQAAHVEKETSYSHVAPEVPITKARVPDVGTMRRRGTPLQYGWIFVAFMVVAILVGVLTYFQHDTATLSDGSDSIHPVPRPIIFDASDWRPGNESLQIGVTPDKGFTKIYFFHLKKPVSIPAGATKLYASIQCEDKAHIVQADLVEPEGNIEDAASYQTRRQWEWGLRQDGRTGSNKTTVEVVVWLGVSPSNTSSPRFEGTYWFDSPPKEN